MKFFSPAKLNLFFRVLRKRSDGYHDIASLYQAIDFGDSLVLEEAEEDRLTCSDPTLPCDESNLIIKALRLFRAHYSFPPVHFHLEKKVPIQAGLGGGSGNAATALWALNQWAGEPASIEELQALGAKIGSDVAFFLSHGTAYCTGRGEVLEPASIAPLSGWIAKPDFGLSTPQVYRETCADQLIERDPRVILKKFLIEPCFFNDLEVAAVRIEPRLVAFKERLLSYGCFHTVAMTGSGSAFFCLGQLPQSSDISFISFNSLQRPAAAWYK